MTQPLTLSSLSLSPRVQLHYEEHSDADRSGLHMLVLHPVTGAIMARRFNPGFFKAGYMDIMEFLQRVQPGRIVILCTQVCNGVGGGASAAGSACSVWSCGKDS